MKNLKDILLKGLLACVFAFALISIPISYSRAGTKVVTYDANGNGIGNEVDSTDGLVMYRTIPLVYNTNSVQFVSGSGTVQGVINTTITAAALGLVGVTGNSTDKTAYRFPVHFTITNLSPTYWTSYQARTFSALTSDQGILLGPSATATIDLALWPVPETLQWAMPAVNSTNAVTVRLQVDARK